MKTIEEVSKILGISRTIIYRRIKRCNLDPTYIKKTRGKQRVFSDSDIEKIREAYLSSGRPKKVDK